MVCFRYKTVNTLHKGDDDDDNNYYYEDGSDDDDNFYGQQWLSTGCIIIIFHGEKKQISRA